MCADIFKKILCIFCLVAAGNAAGYAQATFSAGSTPAIAADIGQAEPTGPINLTIISGTSVEAPILISYSAPITNNDISEITVMGTGSLAGSDVVLNQTENSILLNIPAGATIGDQVMISGVRVAVADLGATQVTASLMSVTPSGNAILAGQTNLVVIGEIKQPFSVKLNYSPPLSFGNGAAIRANTSLLVSEGFPTALTADEGSGRIRITPFPEIPEGIEITFAATAVSDETGALFRTLSGESETIPREDGSTDVVYEFVPALGSPITIESFQFNATMTVETAASGIIQFQVALLPIGLAVPTEEFPSTEVPRYAERLVPDEIDLATGSTELLFPFQAESENTYTGIALTNTHNYRVRATLMAYDEEGNLITGANITNPAQIELGRRGQFAKLATEIFGNGFNALSGGTIRVEGQAPSLQGFYITGDNGGPKVDGAVGTATGALSWYLPVVFRQGNAPFNVLELHNSGAIETVVNLQLMDVNGNRIGSGTRTVAAGGSVAADFREIFGVDPASFEGGYIKGQSSQPLVVRSTFGNSLESNVLARQGGFSLESFDIAHFATGDRYTTELSIVNTNQIHTADLTLTPLDSSGQAIADPVNVKINPGAQMIKTVADLFPNLGSNLITGSILVNAAPSRRGPFNFIPALVGYVRFSNSDGSASAALPLFVPPSDNFVFSHVAQNQGWFTGVGVLNSGTTAAEITVDVYSSDGVLTGTFSAELQQGEKFSKLLKELVPESEGQVGGYIRVSSDANVTGFSLFGTDDLRSLSAIPPQEVR